MRVIGDDSQQLGVIPLSEAIVLARNRGVDLVEVAPNATPPVCRLVDFGKYKYEQEKRQKESKKHQHGNKVKEIQLSATIDPHDFKTKLQHAVDFLCDDMKVKASLRFRGREMAHTEFGFQVVRRFLQEIGPWGHQDFEPKLNGRSINVMISPLPRAKRAKHPDAGFEAASAARAAAQAAADQSEEDETPPSRPAAPPPAPSNPSNPSNPPKPSGNANFNNNPFDGIDLGPAKS